MKKQSMIELYDKFSSELWPYLDDFDREPITKAIWFCKDEAIEEMNKDLLLMMLHEDRDYTKANAMLEREVRREMRARLPVESRREMVDKIGERTDGPGRAHRT